MASGRGPAGSRRSGWRRAPSASPRATRVDTDADGLAAATPPADPKAPAMTPPTAITPARATTTSAPMPAGVRANPARRAPGVRAGRGPCPPGASSMMVRRYAEPRQGTAGPPSPGLPSRPASPRPMPDDRSAPDLIRSVGLMADGPVPWGRPVRHSAPGVFVVELPAPLPSAPLDLALVGKWLERVPGAAPGRHPAGVQGPAPPPRGLLAAEPAGGAHRQHHGVRGRPPVLHGEDGAGRPEARLDRVLAALPAEPARPPRLVGLDRCARGVRGRADRRLRRRGARGREGSDCPGAPWRCPGPCCGPRPGSGSRPGSRTRCSPRSRRPSPRR